MTDFDIDSEKQSFCLLITILALIVCCHKDLIRPGDYWNEHTLCDFKNTIGLKYH